MAPGQRERYVEVRDKFAEINISVSPNVYQNYSSPETARNEASIYKNHLNEFDIRNKCHLVSLKNKQLCKFPQIGFSIMPDGSIYNSCFPGNRLDFFKAPRGKIDSLLFPKTVLCPNNRCVISYRYSFQENCTRNYESLNILENFSKGALTSCPSINTKCTAATNPNPNTDRKISV